MTNPRRRRRLAVQKKGREASVILGKEPVRQSQEIAREVVQDAIDYVEAPEAFVSLGGGLVVRKNAVTYVAPNGSDAVGARGKADKPFLTIPAAITASQKGDVIQIVPKPFGGAPEDGAQ